MAKKRLLLKPKFMIIITLSLAVILVVSAVIELSQVKKEILHIMSEQAASLIESITVSSDNATLAYSELETQVAERLLNNAKMIERFDKTNTLSQKELTEIAAQNNLLRINIFNGKGNKVVSSHTAIHEDLEPLHEPRQFLLPILEGREDEIVIGFKESRFGLGKRYAVAVRRTKGGVVVVNIDAKEMLRLRKEIGVGRLINDMAEKDGIFYIVIQDTLGIIAASKEISSMSKISSDPFLREAQKKSTPSTRLTELNDNQIFEAVTPFFIDGASLGLIRIGLKTDHIAEADTRTKRRLLFISLILLVGGVLVFNFVIVNQNYTLLDEAYLRAKTYTGSILANMTDAVVAIDPDEKITLFNRAAEKLFNIKERAAFGKKCSELVYAETVLEETLRTGKSIQDFETEYKIPGKKAILSVNAFALKTKSGEVDSAVAVIKDLTDRRIMEENLRRKEKLTAMGELASGVAHEVRNPLNAIGMIAQRLSKEFEPKADVDEYKTLSRTVVNEVFRINVLIQRFLKFARPPKLDLQSSDLNNLMDEVIELVLPEADSKGTKVVKKYQTLEKIFIDPNQLKQVFLNLLQNSLQAISKDGSVFVKMRALDNNVVVEIEDTGYGIAKESLAKIFDLYFTTKEDGTGMGLSIANQIVAAHHGSIEVESRVDVGTIFRIILPNSQA